MPTKTRSDAALRVKKIFAEHLAARLAAKKISISRFAKQTGPGRESIRRILDPKNTSISLHTMARTAAALDLELSLSVKPRPIPALMKLVHQGLRTTDLREREKLPEQFLHRFYGSRLKTLHAKNTTVGATA